MIAPLSLARRCGRLCLVALALPALLLAAVATAASERGASERGGSERVALVIGNANYHKVAGLTNSVNDARDVAAVLKAQGVDVIHRKDLDKAAMEQAIGEFGDRLRAGATGIFYYAGHALQMQGQNYLIPVDATLSAEQRTRLETISLDLILDQLSHSKVKVSILILDACRNNPFERKFRSIGAGLAQVNAPEGTLIAYATAPGQVANDGDGENGLYTAELIRVMKEPGLSVEEVFKRVRIAVSRKSNGEQIPWESSSLTGDFYFIPGKRPTAGDEARDAAWANLRLTEDEKVWSSIKESANQDDFKAFVAAYPGSPYAAFAARRLDAMQQNATVSQDRAAFIIQGAVPAPAAIQPSTQGATAQGATALGSAALGSTALGNAAAAPVAAQPTTGGLRGPAWKRQEDIPPLECRTVPVTEELFGYKITKFGSECRQPDGTWRKIH